MALFNDIKVYAGKWSVVKETPISAEEVAEVEKGVVVDSKFGLSVCLYLKAGGRVYFPMTTDSEAGVGRIADVSQITIVELAKSGENNIIRLKVK